MSQPRPVRSEDLEIPDRPVPTSVSDAFLGRRRPLLWGGVAAGALLVVGVVAVTVLSGGERDLGPGAEAPLIKAEDQPIKEVPAEPGGMDVPNRDLLVYGRLQGTQDGKAPVERLLPDPEEPLPPPAPPPIEAAPSPLPPPLDAEEAGTAAPVDAPLRLPEPSAAEPASPPAAPPPVLAQPKAPPAVEKPPAAAKPAPPPTQAKPAAAPAKGGYQVQLFAGRSAEDAKAAWTRLQSRNADLLGPLSPKVARADLGDKGTFYRLRAGPVESDAKAKALCSSLSARGVPCIIVKPAG